MASAPMSHRLHVMPGLDLHLRSTEPRRIRRQCCPLTALLGENTIRARAIRAKRARLMKRSPLPGGLFLAFVVAMFVALVSSPATADHGAWVTHTYTVWDPSPCCFAGYSTTKASDAFDKGAAGFQLWYAGGDLIVQRIASCEGPNESCGPTLRTTTYNWSQGAPSKSVRYLGCGADGGHILPGSNAWLTCSVMSLGTHFHRSADFQ